MQHSTVPQHACNFDSATCLLPGFPLTCACDVLEADTVKYATRNSTDSAYRDLLRRFFLHTEVPMVADSRSLKRKVLIDAFSRNFRRSISVAAFVEDKHNIRVNEGTYVRRSDKNGIRTYPNSFKPPTMYHGDLPCSFLANNAAFGLLFVLCHGRTSTHHYRVAVPE